MKDNPTYPNLQGDVEISHDENGIFIAGTPAGLRSLSEQLRFLADLNPDEYPNIPIGERCHTHLYPGYQLSKNSTETELCRLDAKGTGEFPSDYQTAQQPPRA